MNVMRLDEINKKGRFKISSINEKGVNRFIDYDHYGINSVSSSLITLILNFYYIALLGRKVILSAISFRTE